MALLMVSNPTLIWGIMGRLGTRLHRRCNFFLSQKCYLCIESINMSNTFILKTVL